MKRRAEEIQIGKGKINYLDLHYCLENPKKSTRGLPWWFNGEESVFQSREHGFNLWSGTNIPHATQQLILRVTARDCVLQLDKASSL